MIYGLYTSTVYRICTNFYMLTFAFGSSQHQQRIRQGNGIRQVARHGAPRRHCSTGNHRRMIRLRRAPQRLRRAPPRRARPEACTSVGT